MKKKKHVISSVLPGSIGEELELEPGDALLSINGQPVEDVFDYRYLMNDEFVTLLIRKKNGEEWELEVEKEYEDDLGVEFENSLMDEYRSCSNHCIFCFIDQMPPGMRETLYFKDDDSRLSFLQGNYVTLTNMSDYDLDRIIKFHLSPINVSFQTMNPKLRCKMLHNRFAGDALAKVDRLYKGDVTMNGQIVLCKGINDRDELEYSLEKLSEYAPVLQSVSIVPVGLSRYRKGLYPLESFDKEDARSLLEGEKMYPCYYPTNRSLKALIKNTKIAWNVLHKEKPDLIISCGAAVAVPFFYIGKMMGAKLVYIEVFDRIDKPTMTGKMVYPIVDKFVVQWEEQKKVYPKAVNLGSIF